VDKTPTVTSITVVPTEEFFDANGVTVRAWRGSTDAGADVVALVAGVSSEAHIPGCSPIPPPVVLPEESHDAMAALWRALPGLIEVELRLLSELAIGLGRATAAERRIGFEYLMCAANAVGRLDSEDAANAMGRLARDREGGS